MWVFLDIQNFPLISANKTLSWMAAAPIRGDCQSLRSLPHAAVRPLTLRVDRGKMKPLLPENSLHENALY